MTFTRKKRQLSMENLDSRMLLAADVVTLPDVAVSNQNSDSAHVCLVEDATWSETALEVSSADATAAANEDLWPDVMSLPAGFEPKSIEMGRGQDFFVSGMSWSSLLGRRVGEIHDVSQYAGAIYKGNLRTGEGEILVQPNQDDLRPVLGLSYDARTDYIYATIVDPFPLTNAGIAVYDASTGELVREVRIGDGLFPSNIKVTESAVFVTSTNSGLLYKMPLAEGGRIPDEPTIESIEMVGLAPANGFYAWGLEGSFDGHELLVLNGLNGSGTLYRVDTSTGVSTPVTIHGTQQSFPRGDGLYLQGRTLYIAQTFNNSVAVVQLSGDLSRGTYVESLDCDDCGTPHSLTGFGNSIYVVTSQVLFDPSNPDEDVIFGDPDSVQAKVVRLRK